MKNYKSIEEIDKHLKIIRLQADIYKQRANINSKLVKHSLQPKNLISELIALLGQKYIYKKAFQLLLKRLK